MFKVICVFLSGMILSGCVQQKPPIINKQTSEKIEIVETPTPTSYSYPVPTYPININTYVSNEPYPISNDSLTVYSEQNNSDTVVDTYVKTDQEIVFGEENIGQKIEKQAATEDPSEYYSQEEVEKESVKNSSQIGSFNNPVAYDQTKIY